MTTQELLFEISIIFALLFVNAMLSLSEMALISTRPARLQQLIKEGHSSAFKAVQLAESPSVFLSVVQIGITTVGVLSGAFGGAKLPTYLASQLTLLFGIAERWANLSGSIIVFGFISYFSVVLGELVPKQIGLKFPEKIALVVAYPMNIIAKISYPLVYILSRSTELFLGVLGLDSKSTEPSVTHLEIQAMMAQGEQEGIFENQESLMVNRLLKLSKKRITSIMTQAREIVWIDESRPLLQQIPLVLNSGHSQFPVASKDLQHLLGTVHSKELCKNLVTESNKKIQEMLTQPLLIPNSLDPLETLEQFKRSGIHIGYVIDEFGSIEGLITLNDILEAIVGDIPTLGLKSVQEIVEREDGSWLVEGSIAVEKLAEVLDIPLDKPEIEGLYETIAGFVMHNLGRLPVVSDHFSLHGFRFEVVDMDRNRIDKVLISKIQKQDDKKED